MYTTGAWLHPVYCVYFKMTSDLSWFNEAGLENLSEQLTAALSGPGLFCNKRVKRAIIARTWVEDVMLLSCISSGRGANDRWKILDNPSVWLPESCAGWAKTGVCIVFPPTGIMMDDARSCFVWIYKKLKGYSIHYSRQSEGDRSDSQQMRTQKLCLFLFFLKIQTHQL